jgi:Ser/Thr protein kinase RdoA (MazF antagonist)
MLSSDDGARIAERFDLGVAGSLTGPVARGVVGQVWRLETDRGSWAVKEWFEPPEVDELAEGVAFQEAAAAAGIPSPPTARAPDGAWLVDLDGTAVRVQSWVDLRESDPMLNPEGVGRLVGRLHQVSFEGREPVDTWYTDPIGADRWDALIDELDAARAPFADRLRSLRDDLVALDALVVPPTDVRTCHRDMWADNLRARTTGELCLIDWEDCGLADPSKELALVLWEFGRTDPDRARALHAAYVAAGGPGRVRTASDFSMVIAQLGHIGARACTDWLEGEGSPDDRAFAQAWFAEFSEDPFTLGDIAMLLDALGA